eukprot:jgi/Tetstr1/447233/TSEL_034670.t1
MGGVLEFFAARFGDTFHAHAGAREVDAGIPVMFAGPCDLLNQLAMERVVRGFRGFVARRADYDDFAELLGDISRVSIDGSARMVVIADIHKAPVSETKRLCAAPGAWVVATGRPTPAVSGMLRVERIVPDMPKLQRAIIREAERNGLVLQCYPREGTFDTIGEFIAACDGCAPPDVALASPADTAHRLVASGASSSYICKLVLRHALKGCADDARRHQVVEICAACDAAMARCRRPLVLSKILEYHIAQIARHSSSE